MINKFNKYLLFLSFGLLSAQATRATIQSGPIDYLDQLPEIPLCAVPTLTDAFIEDHLEKMKMKYPDIYRRMQAPSVRHKSAQVGDIEKFWVIVDDDLGGTKSDEIVAKLMAKGISTAVWADTAQLKNATNISDELAVTYIKLLEDATPAGSRDSSKGIYDLELQYFGSPPNKDGDGIVDFLFADIFSGAGGYFTSLDQSNQTGSNKRDILYIDIMASVSYTEGTLSHELQHLIHYNYDTYEEPQFNEGLSEMATIICGGDYISHAHYLSRADQMGWGWDSDASYYAMASLFTLYYVEQLGDGAIKDFIKINAGNNPLQGWRAFDQLLTNYGTGKTHREWLVDWYTANYIDNKLINPKYGYDQWMPMRAKLTAKHLSGKIESSNNVVMGYGPNYIVYASSVDSMEITFTSQSGGTPHIRSVEFNDSTAVTNTLTEGVKHLVYHDSLKVRNAIFVVVSQENYSMKYDYESKGTDASGWTGFEEIAYDDGTADAFTTSDGSQFGYLGWGNNKIGWGWGMKFDPKMDINQLVELKVVVGFAQEFSGSTTPANAEKDFNIHVWEIVDDGGNVKDLVDDPILWSTNRTSITGNWSVIDMTPYKDKLSNLGEVVIGIVDEDTIGTYFAMDKNVNGENYTYAFNYDGSGVLDSLSSFSVGGASLDGWNYLMRASFFIADATVPAMKAGFMQNPVFTDELNLFIIGNSIMDADKMLITAKNAGYETVLDAQTVAGNDSILVTENYRLHASGALDITTKGTFRYGRADIDTTFTYNVNYTLAKAGGDIVSRDNNYIMTIPENSLAEDGYIIVGIDDNSPATQSILLPEKLAPIYTVSPVGKSLEKGARISIDTGALNPAEVSIGYWNGEAWLELNTMISNDGKWLKGVGTHLGHYTLIPKGSGNPLALDEDKVIPTEYALHQNYPNPFNPETLIHFDLPESGHVSLVIYDILGRERVGLVNEYKLAGRYQVLWNGNNSNGKPAVSGIYFYRISSNGFSQTKKMILTR
ncbi:MAG: T9SS type A sorting domain-containing protein [Candidatus Marinimicrobia bacterium]|nr:T9SS type A sorting domain-containing protein [Candidatus Neomarinimicrobiota bacterium]